MDIYGNLLEFIAIYGNLQKSIETHVFFLWVRHGSARLGLALRFSARGGTFGPQQTLTTSAQEASAVYAGQRGAAHAAGTASQRTLAKGGRPGTQPCGHRCRARSQHGNRGQKTLRNRAQKTHYFSQNM